MNFCTERLLLSGLSNFLESWLGLTYTHAPSTRRRRRPLEHFMRSWCRAVEDSCGASCEEVVHFGIAHFRLGAMDWEGQRLAEELMQYFLLASALLALLSGYVAGSFTSMLYIYLAGVVVTFMVTVPDWPFFNRHPFTWLEPLYAEKPSARRQQAAAKKGTKSSSHAKL